MLQASSSAAPFVTVLLILAIYAVYHYVKEFRELRRYQRKLSRSFPSAGEVAFCVEKTLESLPVKYTKDVDEGRHAYDFTFQEGHFNLLLTHDDVSTLIVYFLGFANRPLDNLDTVRMVCNEMNASLGSHVVFYTVDGAENTINLHIKSSLPGDTDTDRMLLCLGSLLSATFSVRRRVLEDLHKALLTVERTPATDVEFSANASMRIDRFVLEAERRSDEFIFRMDNEEERLASLTLGVMLHQVIPLPGGDSFCALEARAEGYHYATTDEDAIWHYPVYRPIMQTDAEGKVTGFAADRGTIIVTYTDDPMGKETAVTHQLVLSLERVRATENVLFFHLFYLVPQLQADPAVTHRKGTMPSAPQAGKILLGYDLSGTQALRAEFDYMWKDAQDKEREGLTSEWTPEQRLIHNLVNEPLAYHLYWGNRLLRDHRAYQAAKHLRYVWQTLNASYEKLNEHSRETFMHTSFLLGLCHMELMEYEVAFYYLHATEGSGEIAHTRTIVNCLMEVNDFRAVSLVDHFLKMANSQIEKLRADEAEVPEYLQSLYLFLRRRYAHLQAVRGNLDTAERLCQAMLDEGVNTAFAENELAFIRERRQQNSANDEAAPEG